MSMISIENTKLDLGQIDLHTDNETQYSQDLPLYLRTLFPTFGTRKLGKDTDNKLYLPRGTNAYLFRCVVYLINGMNKT